MAYRVSGLPGFLDKHLTFHIPLNPGFKLLSLIGVGIPPPPPGPN